MPKKSDTPFDRIFRTRAELDMLVRHPEMLDRVEVAKLVADAQFTVATLMKFRNIINGMVALDEDPSDAVRPYLDETGA
jgi:hypothetical protein